MENLQTIRSSAEATNVTELDQYSVIGYFLESNSIDKLMYMLSHRLRYGVFVDKFLGNFLMNRFLDDKQYVAAARIAVELMIQEDLNSDLVKGFAVLSCYQCLSKGDITQLAIVEKTENPPTDAKEVSHILY